MPELIFLKLGGSLLTDKARPRAARPEVLARLANEIAAARVLRPAMRLLIGHGSGSFGHVVASRYGTRAGVRSPEEWRGYAATALAAGQLDRLVLDALAGAGVPVLPIQPSASAICHAGELQALADGPILAALANGLAPVLYGDVAVDDVRGGTIISTEEIFRWLAPRLAPERVLLVGEAPGVLPFDPGERGPADLLALAGQVIPEITLSRLPELVTALGGARGVDVTGGMLAKVQEMATLVAATPSLAEVRLISGLTPGILQSVLLDPGLQVGTVIRR